jgi:hypothetical protein
MATIDTRPKVVDIIHYGGDTLIIRIEAPASVTDGKVWDAHVKTAAGTTVPAAEFDITPPTVQGGPAFLTLPSATCAALVAGQPVLMRRTQEVSTREITNYAIKTFTGVWDCQVSVAHSDPVRTLVKGALTIEQDVTQP